MRDLDRSSIDRTKKKMLCDRAMAQLMVKLYKKKKEEEKKRVMAENGDEHADSTFIAGSMVAPRGGGITQAWMCLPEMPKGKK